MPRTRDLRGENLFDSRDAQARLDELESEREAAKDAATQGPTEDTSGTWIAPNGDLLADTWDEDQESEWQALVFLKDDYSGSEGWYDGVGFIRDSYFETYARELAEDIGAISGDEGWPLNCIDWEKACRELKHDYSSTEFDGVDYWYRS